MKLPPSDWWRSVFVLLPVILVSTAVLGTISLASTLVDRRGLFAHRCAQWWSRSILAISGVTIDRRGALPPGAPGCIFVANHASFFDIPILFAALPRQLRIIAKAGLGKVPFIGWHLRLAGHLLVDRSNPGAAIFKKMQRMAAQGASLIVFPEGSRSRTGAVAKFKGGVFLLAIETGLPIVPVSVSGSHAVMPRGRMTVHSSPVRVTVHPEVPTAGLTREDARSLAEQVRQVVAAAV